MVGKGVLLEEVTLDLGFKEHVGFKLGKGDGNVPVVENKMCKG